MDTTIHLIGLESCELFYATLCLCVYIQVEREFKIDANTFKVVDVGGQRNERKKWIHW